MKEKKWIPMDKRMRVNLAILLVLFLFILMRGGYFYYESLMFLGLAGFLQYHFLRNQPNIKMKIGQEDILPVLFFFFYCLPIFWADSMHFYGALKMFSPFLLAKALQKLDNAEDLIKKAMVAYALLLGIALVLYGIEAIFGVRLIEYPVAIKQRFTGFLQYANVNAILSLIAGVICIYTLVSSWKSMLLTIFCGMSLGLSGSRTSWLLAVVVMVAIAGNYLFLYLSRRGQPAEKVSQPEISNKQKMLRIVVFFISVLLGAYVISKQLDSSRLQDGLQASELQTRLLYYQDGIEMLSKNLWGYGHYGYFLIQRQWQTGSMYHIKYIHNFLLQIALDGGIISAILFMGMLVRTFFRLFRKIWQGHERAKLWLLLLAIATWHSLLDFNFEFSFFVFLWWLVYEKMHMSSQVSTCSGNRWIGAKRIGAIALSTVSLIFGIFSVMTLYDKEELPARLGFSDAQERLLLSDRYTQETKVEIAEQAVEKSVKSVEMFAFLRDYYYNKGKLEKAISYGRQVVKLAPLWLIHRQELMRIEYAYALQNEDRLDLVAEDILGLPALLAEMEKTKATKWNVRHRPQWKMTDEMQHWYMHFKILYQRQKEYL